MEALTCRLLPWSSADGATNMAADEALVRWAAASGAPAFRCYGWDTATVSLGYFQPAAARQADPRLVALPWVRRPSGGATLVHHREMTYALALPPALATRSVEPWMIRMHRLIVQALGELGLAGRVHLVTGETIKHGDVLCFQQYTPGDVLCAGRKVVGSAQRKYHLALMQHGSVLLEQSEHTPALPGLRELTGVSLTAEQMAETLMAVLARDTGWALQRRDTTTAERAEVAELAQTKYAAAAWNEKR